MARPDLGTKRLCPNCGAKYYDLNRDPILCPKCNAAFATGVIAARHETANDEEDDETEADDDAVELVSLEDAEDDDAIEAGDDDDIEAGEDVDVDVDADDAALIDDDDDDDDEVSDVVRPGSEDDEDR